MSSSNRATSKGGKGAKADKSHKSDKSDRKSVGDKQQHRDGNSKGEDPSIKEKVTMLIDMTQRSEEEVCLALHESDYDVNGATNMLFESMAIGEWETRVKKKKKQPSAGGGKQDGSGAGKPEDGSAADDDWNDGGAPAAGGGGPREGDRRNRSGGPPRLHGGRGNDGGGGGRGWRGRERHENERNLDDGSGGGYRGGRGGRSAGAPRGGSGRGRGGGRAGGRYPPRGGNRNNSYNKPIETWDNSNTWDNSTAINTNHNAEESWDDFPGADEWSTEEYQGSLADTKVFTPSVQTGPEPLAVTEPPGLQDQPPLDNQQLGPQQQPVQSQSPVPPMVGALTAAQTQYFSQLQQNNDPLVKQYVQVSQAYQAQSYEKASSAVAPASPSQYASAAAQTYQSPYSVVSGGVPAGYQQTYGSAAVGQDQSSTTQQQSQQQRTKTQRARVPPPSKIPASAVEMPGDLNSSIGYLDVQFGGMDLIDGNSSFEAGIDTKYVSAQQTNNMDTSGSAVTPTGLDLNVSGQNGANLDGYSHKSNTQGSISSALSQSLSNADSIPPTTVDHLSNAYSGTSSRSSTAAPTSGTVAPSAVSLELAKQQQSEGHSSYSQPSSYNSYQAKTNSGGYNSSNYSTTQTTAASYVSNQAASYVNSQSAGGYNVSSNSYQNAYSTNSSYQSGNTAASAAAFPSISQANTYPSNSQSYPQNTSQSVYGANTGLNNSYGSGSGQYNSYGGGSGGQHKLGKDGAYDTSNATSSSQTTTSVTSSASLSLSQTTASGSKTSTTLAKNSNSIVSNIPPGVAPVMSTPYIMGHPYFQQPVYSYEDMQLLQQRLPHMTTPYYDMSYQTTPTTLATVRDAAALGNVGYTIGGDARFAAAAAAAAAAAGRTDNSASPSPSSSLSVGGQSGLSSSQGQQQAAAAAAAAQQQPMLAGAAPPPPYFFAATAFNTLAPNYQFGTMYTQLPTATNAHGSSNSTQYPKPATYGSGYGGYDALGQTAQDYAKGGYVGAATQAQKGGGANTTSAAGSTGGANDLSTMYAKSHTALGKVNSYEKQGFHSGTPPPFTGTMHGSQSGGLAPSGTGYAPQVYIPTMAPHQQHHSTHLMQQPLHQMDIRHQSRRVDSSNTGGQRSQASNQAKGGTKQPYQASYWNQA